MKVGGRAIDELGEMPVSDLLAVVKGLKLSKRLAARAQIFKLEVFHRRVRGAVNTVHFRQFRIDIQQSGDHFTACTLLLQVTHNPAAVGCVVTTAGFFE